MWSSDIMFRQYVSEEVQPLLGDYFADPVPSHTSYSRVDGAIELTYNSTMLRDLDVLIDTLRQRTPSCMAHVRVIPSGVQIRLKPRSLLTRYLATVTCVVLCASFSIYLLYKSAVALDGA